VWDFYGLKSAGAAFRNTLADCMNNLGWKPYHAAHHLSTKAETHPEDDVMHWDYMLIFVDDILCVNHDPCTPMANLDEYFKMKEDSIQAPIFYLGARLKKTVFPNGVVSWGMISSKYAQSAVQNVQEYLSTLHGDKKLLKKAPDLFTEGYKPDIDESS
jgi:hypothetical protein